MSAIDIAQTVAISILFLMVLLNGRVTTKNWYDIRNLLEEYDAHTVQPHGPGYPKDLGRR